METPKERILKTAAILFHQHGYNTTGVNAIIEHAKVAKASFYDHYPTKEDLAIAYLDYRHKIWFEGLLKDVNEENTEKRKVLAAFEYIKKMNQKENYRGCAFLNMLSEIPQDHEELRGIIHKHKSELQAFFQKIVTNKERAFIIYMLFESCLTESQVY